MPEFLSLFPPPLPPEILAINPYFAQVHAGIALLGGLIGFFVFVFYSGAFWANAGATAAERDRQWNAGVNALLSLIYGFLIFVFGLYALMFIPVFVLFAALR